MPTESQLTELCNISLMQNLLYTLTHSYKIRKILFQVLLLGIILAGVVISNFGQSLQSTTPDFEEKVWLIDSARSSRIETYLKHCFTESAIEVDFRQQHGNICSLEMAFWVAQDISDDQFPLLRKFVTEVSHHYNRSGVNIMFEYGIVPGSVDYIYDRMFNKKVIYVLACDPETIWDEVTTYSRVYDLIGTFNAVTENYISGKAGVVATDLNSNPK